MKKALQRIENKIWHYTAGARIEGLHSLISGDVSGLRGDVSGLRGDVSGLRGDVSGIHGNVNECGITASEREKGVDVRELIQ